MQPDIEPTTTEQPATVEQPVQAAQPAPAAPAAPTAQVQATQPTRKNHTTAILLSVFLGHLGIDRFYLGHTGLGIAKLFLSWLTFGIWWLVDLILVCTKRVKNVEWE